MRHDEDTLIDRVAATLRTPERIDPSFDARVMAEVHALPAPRRRPSLWKWLMQPRPVSVSPIGGLAFGGAMAALLLIAGMRGEPTAPVAVAPAVVQTTGSRVQPVSRTTSTLELATVVLGRTVQFTVVPDSAATSVAVVGDFNDWKPDSTMLRRTSTGAWTVTVRLEPGRYTYNYLVDGRRWIVDPAMPEGPTDEFFGRPSSIVTVGDPVR